jgi:hypothetical protein
MAFGFTWSVFLPYFSSFFPDFSKKMPNDENE